MIIVMQQQAEPKYIEAVVRRVEELGYKVHLSRGEARTIIPGLRWMRFPLPFPPSNVNVWLLEDGEKLDVPFMEGASPVLTTPIPEVVTSTTELIDINTASTEELEELPGIGPTTSQKIVEQLLPPEHHRPQRGLEPPGKDGGA